jgi:hypothetical protein
MTLMSPLSIPESHWFALLQASCVFEARADSLAAFVGIAAYNISRGETQEGADVLAWVMRQPLLSTETHEMAHILWDDLATWICPRVLLDAADFAQYATFDDLYEYVMLPL